MNSAYGPTKKNSATLNSAKRAIQTHTYGLFRWRGEGEGVEGCKIELTKNKLILY